MAAHSGVSVCELYELIGPRVPSDARGLVLTGVVVLAQPAPGFAYPAHLLTALSQFWAGTGEVSTLLAADENAPER
jgi:hypothetical protein